MHILSEIYVAFDSWDHRPLKFTKL